MHDAVETVAVEQALQRLGIAQLAHLDGESRVAALWQAKIESDSIAAFRSEFLRDGSAEHAVRARDQDV